MRISLRLFAVSLIFFIQSCTSDDNSKAKLSTILLKTTGEVTFQPDLASVSIVLECTDMDIKKSRECLIIKSNKLNKDLLKYDLSPEDILTTSINQYKEYNWENNSRIFIGYKSSMTTSLTIRDLKILERLYSDLLINENISIENLSYNHSKFDSLNNLAYQKALESANILADQLLKKMDKKEKEILRVGNVDLSAEGESLTIEERAIALANGDNLDLKINIGTLKIKKALFVEYKIK